jgi:hypothetical protein
MANSTLTREHRAWVSEPDGRGTMGLIWSCLSVLFICSWSTIHLNVPAHKDSDLRIFFRKLGYATICLIAPEYLITGAAEQRMECIELINRMATITNNHTQVGSLHLLPDSRLNFLSGN